MQRSIRLQRRPAIPSYGFEGGLEIWSPAGGIVEVQLDDRRVAGPAALSRVGRRFEEITTPAAVPVATTGGAIARAPTIT